ncbi:EAL domain-containing protein [Sphingomonas koreensis]|nr:EAL domain-containing protein [Sphingomonas koreensis]
MTRNRAHVANRTILTNTIELSPTLQADLQTEQFRILRAQVPILYAVLAINTAILSFSIFGSVPATLSLIVPGVFAGLIALRATVWLTRQRSHPSDARVARFLTNTTIIAAVVSLGLGLWGVLLLHAGVADKPFVPLFIAFGAIACAYCLASLPRAAFATISLATAPVIVSLLLSGDRLQEAAGLNLLLIFLLILRLIRHQYRYLVESVVSHSDVKSLAYTDWLTGLPNRRAFIECLGRFSEPAGDGPTLIAVAMIDLDGFKAINDTYGHDTGDAVLIQAAERIQTACPNNLMIARLGGDEFAVLMNARDLSQGTIGGEAIVAEISKPFLVGDLHIRLAASIGLAQRTGSGDSPAALMSQADMALYEVKHASGNCVRDFAPEMACRLHRRISVEQALRETDPPPDITVVYQPIFDARSMRLTTFEALARWQHPTLGTIDPLEFIEVAERTGTIGALSEQIFAAAINQASRWPPTTCLSINLSAVELSQPSTPLKIMAICDAYGFDPRRLEVEVTETAVLADFEIARQQLDLLRQTGIKVVLDDFGAGFASITYLKEISFDRLKIDGELITEIITSEKARRLVQGILQLCSAVGVPATAEKVECERQRAVLEGLGCDRLQGYLLSRPLDAAAAEHFARASLGGGLRSVG